jgi:MFS family permease
MGAAVGRIAALLAGTALLLVAVGLIGSLVPLELYLRGVSAGWIGAAGAAYYLGLLVGSFGVVTMLGRVGQVRTYTALTALTAAAILTMALTDQASAWLLARLAMGACMGGTYVVIESWLTSAAPEGSRGGVLGLYQWTLSGARRPPHWSSAHNLA